VFSVNNYYSGSWVDISDYIIGAGEVPYISRNRDYSMRLEILTLQIAGTLQNIRGSDYNFLAGDKFTIKDDSTFLFLGEVVSSIFNYDRNVYELEIKSALNNLIKYSCNHDTLHTTLLVSDNWYDYTPRDYDDNRIVGISYLISTMFTLAGLTLDSTTANATVLWNDSTTGFGDITFRELLVDEDMFYCLNQDVAAVHNDPTVDVSKTPTFYEFISEMCSVFGLMFRPTGADGGGNFTYTLIVNTASTPKYTITDNNKFSYSSDRRAADYRLVFSGVEYGYSSLRSNYRSGTHNITKTIAGALDKKADYFLNFYCFYSDISLTTGSWQTITGATQIDAEHVQVTSWGHTFNNGDYIVIKNVVGMTDLNDTLFLVSSVTANTYEVLLTTGQTYTSGGKAIELQNNAYRDLIPNAVSIDKEVTDKWNPIHYKMTADVGNQVDNDYLSETIECPYNTTFYTVVENFIDLENRTSKIIQEDYT